MPEKKNFPREGSTTNKQLERSKMHLSNHASIFLTAYPIKGWWGSWTVQPGQAANPSKKDRKEKKCTCILDNRGGLVHQLLLNVINN